MELSNHMFRMREHINLGCDLLQSAETLIDGFSHGGKGSRTSMCSVYKGFKCIKRKEMILCMMGKGLCY